MRGTLVFPVRMPNVPEDDLIGAMEAALVAECWQLPEELRGQRPVDVQVELHRRLALELLTAGELPREYKPGGYADPPPEGTPLVGVVERVTDDDRPGIVRKRSRFFRAAEPWMAVRRSDMPPTTAGFRPGADTLVGDVVRQTAPGEAFSEEAPVIMLSMPGEEGSA